MHVPGTRAAFLAAVAFLLLSLFFCRPAPIPGPVAPGPAVAEHIAAREYWASRAAEGLQAPNRRHDLRVWFEPSGVRVHDRTAAGSPSLVELRLLGVGRGERLAAAGPGVVTSREARVEIRRGALVEWYANSPAGLEQGFTLAERPESATDGDLVVELEVRGARARMRGDEIALVSGAGRTLRYGALAAVDAEGSRLAASFEVPAADRVRLVVADADASYPIVIDPLLTGAADAQVESDQAGAGQGSTIASAGDVNGDGHADLIVGAPFYDAGQTDEGAAFVFLGSATGIGDATPATAAAQLEADQASAQLGAAVASAGDVNGDGYDDVIVGAPLYDAGVRNEGAAFVFLGSANGIADGTPATAHARLESDERHAELGSSVASAGDVNGDGFADVIVGALEFGSGDGAAFVFLGSAGGMADSTPATAHAQLAANQSGAGMGASVAAGDVNGDGYADVIVGASLYDAGQADEGVAFVFLGSASGIVGVDPATAHAQLEADQAGAQLGSSVAAAGDLNGDGYGDLVVGAPLYDAGPVDEGGAFVFYGSAGGVGDGTPASAGARLRGNQAAASLGASVAGAGDVNGDGYADVVIGAPLYDAGQVDEGAAFVFLGSASGVPDGSPANAYAQLESDEAAAQLGASVASAGDVDADGYADVAVGVPLRDAGQLDEGAGLVFHGASAGITDGTPSAHLTGSGAMGHAVASAGDVNGDGYSDVIVGAYTYDGGPYQEGAAFVFLGSATGIEAGSDATADFHLEGNQASSWFGFSVSSAGDVNGDGYADVIVGAPHHESEASQELEGAAFVFLGSAGGIVGNDPATAHARFEGDQASAQLGTSVASAGDVDGDGYADVIVGSRGYSAGQSFEGAAFVFRGSAGGIASGSPATAHARLEGDQASSSFGLSVASAGDVNGDGYGDVIVGAPHYDAGETDEGAAFVFLGSSSGIADGSPATAHAQLESDQAWVENVAFGAGLGSSVASAGDVNGDGYADVIVGAPLLGPTSAYGAAFVFLGSASGVADGTPATAHARLESDDTFASMGEAVASAGDVNGDGYADVIVGAPSFHPYLADYHGAAFVFLGSESGLADATNATAYARLTEASPLYGTGASVGSAGDVDGDGYADLIAGVEGGGFRALVYHGRFRGRPVRARPLRGDGSGVAVQPWGGSGAAGAFEVSLRASHPSGAGRVRAEIEACETGVPFGAASCTTRVGFDWSAVGGGAPDAALTETVSGLEPGALYRWRARVQLAGATGPLPASPAHGPWRRPFAQAVEADVRTTPPACANGRDDDGDTFVDHPADPGCSSGLDTAETNPAVACDDGADNDGDALIDFPGDTGCASAVDATETSPVSGGCGMGPELVAVLAGVAWLRRRRRR